MTKLPRVLSLIGIAVTILFVFMPRDGQAAAGEWTDASPGNYCGGGPCSSMRQACTAIAYAWYSENPESKLISCSPTSSKSVEGKVPAYCCGATYKATSFLSCPAGFRADAESTQGGCVADKEPFLPCSANAPSPGAPNPTPSAGNPVCIAEGTKWQTEIDFTTGGLNALSFERHYNSDGRAQTSVFPMPLGIHWQSNFDIYLSAPDASTRELYQPDGSLLTFTLVGSVWTPPAPIPVKLEQVADTWEFTDTADRVHVFDSSLRLVAITKRNGYQQTLAYDGEGRLETVTDTYGRSFTLG